MLLPKGTKIDCTAHFDNSPNNPNNPDPTKDVKWGDQTWEEMMIGFFDVAFAAGMDPKSAPGKEEDHHFVACQRRVVGRRCSGGVWDVSSATRLYNSASHVPAFQIPADRQAGAHGLDQRVAFVPRAARSPAAPPTRSPLTAPDLLPLFPLS